jgi:hypothetical protein
VRPRDAPFDVPLRGAHQCGEIKLQTSHLGINPADFFRRKAEFNGGGVFLGLRDLLGKI